VVRAAQSCGAQFEFEIQSFELTGEPREKIGRQQPNRTVPADQLSGGIPSGELRRIIVLSLLCGVVIGLFYPFVAKALIGKDHLGPYMVFFAFTLGALVANFPLNYAFMRHPVSGIRRRNTQNRRSAAVSFGRFPTDRFSTPIWWRRAKFSSCRAERARNIEPSVERKTDNRIIMDKCHFLKENGVSDRDTMASPMSKRTGPSRSRLSFRPPPSANRLLPWLP